ncbi:adenosylcobinamide-phosphate synthase CbiB [Asaia krungthepensis]|uniref:Cobalamin biosynthesis protein CobD n=1 Tax=Asaia krungthepensis NRIC 0535 TaxID=1307925 RepID=A0ABQ0Q1A8_9PROT|nr:adenosylcobinamide-phosphate synthase CbiB [Asaia krungthepensis]GBQ86723.1 cobalamin biosynthesis protein CobD/CbiB [Asaia krungthepensis NRIC 0535]
MFLSLTLLALLVESAFGYPDALFRRIGHPVTWIGRLITMLDRRLNTPPRDTTGNGGNDAAARPLDALCQRTKGVLALLLIVSLPTGLALAATRLAQSFLPEWVVFLLQALGASTLIAQKSLRAHVQAVLTGLRQNGLEGGRHAVAQIVGRDPDSLDESGVIRAAIESLSENFSDGVVAPVFWLAVFGLPGIVAYKAINTADSMIGHMTPRHADFGRAAALTDDCVNIPASRLTALWLVLAGLIPGTARDRPTAESAFETSRNALTTIRRDAHRHRSPNAGWPEAAMAGLLALRLAGPRHYKGKCVTDSWMGNGRAEARQQDLANALGLYRIACVIQAAFLVLLMVLFGHSWS